MKDPHKRTAPMLSVVFSFRNEADVLPELIGRTRQVLDDQCEKKILGSFEMVFVNDDSTDDSLAILKEHASEPGRSDIKIINMSRNFGVAPCVLAGMEHTQGDAVVYMDADLQDPPETLPAMIQKWVGPEKADVVHTIRLSRAGESKLKLWTTRAGYHLIQKMATIDLQIESGDFKLLSRRVVDQLILLQEKNPYVRGLVSWIGFKHAKVKYHREARFAGQTKFPTLCSPVVKHFFDTALISFSDIPLKLSSMMGFLVCFSSFIYIGWIMLEKFRGHNIPGWSALMVTVLFLGGMQFMSLGILGLYIKSIYLQSKGRPNYIVQSTFGFDKQTHQHHQPHQYQQQHPTSNTKNNATPVDVLAQVHPDNPARAA